MEKLNGFEPVIGSNPQLLILGTILSVESIINNEYYGNKRNHFWKIIFQIFDLQYEEDYHKRLSFLKSKHIALWDVIKTCERKGSLDSNIKDEEPNDFASLFKEYPTIKHVFFNGSKAYDIYKKKIGFNQEGIKYHKLCSTSPAHAISIDKKIDIWRIIKICLND